MDTIASLLLENEALKQEIIALKTNRDQAQTDKNEQQEYQDTQDRFRTVFEASRLGNKIISADLLILQVNTAMVQLLGYTAKDEIVGKRIIDYSPPEFQKDWKFLQEKLWQQATPSFSLETCLSKKDGTAVWCQVTSILFVDHGETLGYTIIEDITEKHQLRAQREEFISVASHELKTPITSLRATIQLMNRLIGEQPGIPEKILQLAQNTERYCNKLNHMVADLLNSTSIENGQLNLNKSWFTVGDIINGCCSHIRLGGKYQLDYRGDHQLRMYADELKIDQVLVNFVNNAIKYAPESLVIVIETVRIAGSIKVSVTDHGHGIPPESLPRLFERYYRASQNGNATPGLGLGLYISSEIIKRHGGEIGVESQLGEGTTFWFTIPVSDIFNDDYYKAEATGTPRYLADNRQEKTLATQ